MKRVICIVVILVFASCKKEDIKGVVIEKIHQKSYTYTTIIPMNAGKTTMMIPHTNHVPDKWILIVQDSITHDISVSYESYNIIAVGDSLFRINKKVMYKNQPNHEPN